MMEVIQSFFDPDTFTISYVVSVDGDAVVIDPVLDFDPASGKTATRSLKKLLEYVREKNLSIHYILETHAHADHLSAAQHLRDQHF
jgi:glyoxylase-like metal-dependent hydrolase (beta-lactamase superfamily II)